MSEYMFTLLSKIGFREQLIEVYGFNSPSPSYTLRVHLNKYQFENSINLNMRRDSHYSENSNSCDIHSIDEGNDRIHIISSKFELTQSSIIEKMRNNLRNSVIDQIQRNLSSSQQEEYHFNSLQVDSRYSKPSLSENRNSLPYKVISESNSQLEISHLPSEQDSVERTFEVYLVSHIKKMVYKLPDLDKLKVTGYLLKTRTQQIISSIMIRYFQSNFVILYSHGNSCDLGLCLDALLDLAFNLKINLFAYEYCGYGQSTGQAKDLEIINCAEAAYQFLLQQYQWNQIILYGYSIGSGPTIALATLLAKSVGGIILHSPIASGLRTVLKKKQLQTNFYDIFPNVDLIGEIKSPILLMHGKKDTVVPFESSQLLAENINKKYLYNFWQVEEGNHYNLDISTENRKEYFSQLRQFLEYLYQMPFKIMIQDDFIPKRVKKIDHLYWNYFLQHKGKKQLIFAINQKKQHPRIPDLSNKCQKYF